MTFLVPSQFFEIWYYWRTTNTHCVFKVGYRVISSDILQKGHFCRPVRVRVSPTSRHSAVYKWNRLKRHDRSVSFDFPVDSRECPSCRFAAFTGVFNSPVHSGSVPRPTIESEHGPGVERAHEKQMEILIKYVFSPFQSTTVRYFRTLRVRDEYAVVGDAS